MKPSEILTKAFNDHGRLGANCPMIAMYCEAGIFDEDHIRNFPSLYDRLSCRKVLQMIGIDDETRIYDIDGYKKSLNVVIFNMIDGGYNLLEISSFLKNKGL